MRLSISGNPLFDIETIELERGGKSYTIDTMKLLTAMHPDTDYYFIIGGDMVEYLPKWKTSMHWCNLCSSLALLGQDMEGKRLSDHLGRRTVDRHQFDGNP